MKIKEYKCGCGHDEFFFADKGNQTGIYCSYCGKWLKWADKNEQNLAMKQESQSSSENPNKWILCSERLPEERGHYIVTEKVFSLDDREHKGRYNTMVEQVEYYDGKWKRASFFEIVAWMPLPLPYKQEVKDEYNRIC